jgi:hypothetical protein
MDEMHNRKSKTDGDGGAGLPAFSTPAQATTTSSFFVERSVVVIVLHDR